MRCAVKPAVLTILLSLLLFPASMPVPRAQPASAASSLAKRIAHTDPSRVRPSPAVHGGAGHLEFTALLTAAGQDTSFYFLHRGVIAPKSGIGAHFHNQCEEMFVILGGEAQFTIDGRTSTLKGPAGAPTRMGHSHGIYNATDSPLQWLNINVTVLKGVYDAFNLDDPRVNVSLDPIPPFMTMKLDRAALRSAPDRDGVKGTAQYRRALGPSVFATTWSYVDHLLLPAAASTGGRSCPDMPDLYYVLSVGGTFTVGSEPAPVRNGDALAIRLNERQSFAAAGGAPLELLIVGVSRDMDSKVAMTMTPSGGRGDRENF